MCIWGRWRIYGVYVYRTGELFLFYYVCVCFVVWRMGVSAMAWVVSAAGVTDPHSKTPYPRIINPHPIILLIPLSLHIIIILLPIKPITIPASIPTPTRFLHPKRIVILGRSHISLIVVYRGSIYRNLILIIRYCSQHIPQVIT